MFNKKIRKIASVALAGSMVLSMAACGNESEDPKPTPTTAAKPNDDDKNPSDDNNPGNNDDQQGDNDDQQDNTDPESGCVTLPVAPHEGSTPRTIRVGSWYDFWYDSNDKDIYSNPNVGDLEDAQMMFDNLKRVEEKYNIRLEYVNLTWEGVTESISTSIMSGTPDCDIYMVDLIGMGVPAMFNGYVACLEDFMPAEADIFNDQTVLKNFKMPDSDQSYFFTSVGGNNGGCLLGFNADMIDEAGLENPQDLYDRGEWTWEKFREYCRILTKDTDGDTVTDQWGYSGFFTDMFASLLMSNNAHVAGGEKEGLSSPATIEVLDFAYQLYQVDKTARPFDYANWDLNASIYNTGTVGFWTTQIWFQHANGLSSDVGFEIGMVPWPIGPSGNQETNSQVVAGGSWYFIPVGVERPELVLSVFEEIQNWYNGDVTLRDDTEWNEDGCETERNWGYMKAAGETMPWFDLWANVSGLSAIQDVIAVDSDAASTAAQAAEKYKQVVQDYLDTYINSSKGE